MPGWIRRHWLFIAIVVVGVGGWLSLRSSATTFEPGTTFESLLAGSEPIVLDFFGNT